MMSKVIAAVTLPVAFLPSISAGADSLYGVQTYTDSTCMVSTGEDANGLASYKMAQLSEDKHCYFNNGYSIKISCGNDDTVTVDHWIDLAGNKKPCSGDKMAGEPLMKDIPWEIAVDFFNGDCVQSTENGLYGKLTAALPTDGFPTCDFTGASIRRLNAHSNTTNSTNNNSTNSTNGTNNNNGTTSAPTPAPTSASTSAPTPTPAPGTASGAVSLKVSASGLVAVTSAGIVTVMSII